MSWAKEQLASVLEKFICSSLYRTAPQDDLGQDAFLNAVVGGLWSSSALQLLNFLQNLEQVAGRVRDATRPKGPRCIDLDLLLFGENVIETLRLSVPHPQMKNRAFVLVPLLECFPDATDPRTGMSWALALSNLKDQGVALSDRYW